MFAGDCGDCQKIRELSKGADTLVLACTHFGPPMSEAIADVITGAPEAASIAMEAGAKRAVLAHGRSNFMRPGVKERAVAEVGRSYTGEILFPDELTTIDL